MPAMEEIRVQVYKDGHLKDSIQRPLHLFGKDRVVKYKKKFWLLDGKDRIHLELGPYVDLSAMPAEEASLPASMHVGSDQEVEIGVAPAGPIVWTDEQRRIIESSGRDRLLVSACPGAGKTAVACARVAWLIDTGGIPPSKLIVVSFSRTAVREIRNRIGSYLKDPNVASSIPIATIDSYAWQVHTGFSSDALSKPLERIGYEENIGKLQKLVETDELVQDYLRELKHVVVDEAQDILGTRADLMASIFSQLEDDCGVTVLGDEAQSIYGFSGDVGDTDGASDENLMSRVGNHPSIKFRRCELNEVHRTTSAKLKHLFTEVRTVVLNLKENDQAAPGKVAHEVALAASGTAVNKAHPESLAGADNAFVLYRRRAEVLQASAYFSSHNVAHRLRMSGLPNCVYPWVGAVLGNYAEQSIGEDDFIALWRTACRQPWISCGLTAEDAWKILRQLDSAKRGGIRLSHLRRILGRSQPPVQACLPDFGYQGPVLGTIHASKGREADIVHLLLPARLEEQEYSDPPEEARVLFVGGTRAKGTLFVGTGTQTYATSIGTRKRIVSKKSKSSAQLQVGCIGDISPQSMAGHDYFKTAAEVGEIQDRLMSHEVAFPRALKAVAQKSNEYAYELGDGDDGKRMGWLDRTAFNRDLWEIGRHVSGVRENGPKPPAAFNHIWMFGVRTLVVPPDSPAAESLHDPWAASGFLLAPMISAYTMAYYHWSKP